jgi:hypothetical protein
VITRDASLITAAYRGGELPADSPAAPKGVFMVEPVNFHVSEETALDNRYMNPAVPVDPDVAMEQYIDLVQMIRDAGVSVKSFPGDAQTPDDVFPNNVFATIPGRLIVGHMLYPGRQLETKRQDIRNYFENMGYETADLSDQDCVAELTGPMVIDRSRKLGYCGMTNRVDEAGLKLMHDAFDLRQTLQFDLREEEYHTNVVMSVLAGRACVLHSKSLLDRKVARALFQIYEGHIIYLDQVEKEAFVGNCIALKNSDLFMSRSAEDALSDSNRSVLESWGFRIHAADISELEKAGGSLRCMVAEIF